MDLINNELLKDEIISEFNKAFTNKSPLSTTKFSVLTTNEQSVGCIHQFLTDDFCKEIQKEILQCGFEAKENDLYSFKQSQDLLSFSQPESSDSKPALSKFRQLLTQSDFLSYFYQMTGIEALGGKEVDLAGQIYTKGNHLLCHDDDINEDSEIGRRVAFILYLVEDDFKEGDGGELMFFKKDEEGLLPVHDQALKILPKWNQFCFFEVTPTSYHQVMEILTDQPRISLTGWLYGKIPSHFPALTKSIQQKLEQNLLPLNEYVQFNQEAIKLEDWIHGDYFKPRNQKKIKQTFLRESFIELPKFLKHSKLKETLDQLKESQLTQHPPNVARLHSFNQWKQLELYKVFTSLEFRDLIQKLFQLDNLSEVKCQLWHFQSGDYTLIHDDQVDAPGLDLIFCLSSVSDSEMEDENSGNWVYMDQEETLLQIEPVKNQLCAVYRENTEIQRFVKYLQKPLEKLELVLHFPFNDQK